MAEQGRPQRPERKTGLFNSSCGQNTRMNRMIHTERKSRECWIHAHCSHAVSDFHAPLIGSHVFFASSCHVYGLGPAPGSRTINKSSSRFGAFTSERGNIHLTRRAAQLLPFPGHETKRGGGRPRSVPRGGRRVKRNWWNTSSMG